jgi:hypothetical protein
MAAASSAEAAASAAGEPSPPAVGSSPAVLIAGSAPEAVEIDLSTCRAVTAADDGTIQIPQAALDAWGFVQELGLGKTGAVGVCGL